MSLFSLICVSFRFWSLGRQLTMLKSVVDYIIYKLESFSKELKANSSAVVSPNSEVSPYNEEFVMLWHYRLGHPNLKYFYKMFLSLFNKNKKKNQCEMCQLSKHTRSTYAPKPYKPFQLFSLIHIDLWRPSWVSSITNAK